jgi:hypothetical protein
MKKVMMLGALLYQSFLSGAVPLCKTEVWRGPNLDINSLLLRDFEQTSAEGELFYSCFLPYKDTAKQCILTLKAEGKGARFAHHLVRHLPEAEAKKMLICYFCKKSFSVFQHHSRSKLEFYREHMMVHHIAGSISVEELSELFDSTFNNLLWQVLLIKEEVVTPLKNLSWLTRIRPPKQEPLADHEKIFSEPSAIMMANTAFVQLASDQESL